MGLDKLDALFTGKETVDERIRILLNENKKLRGQIAKRDSGAEVFLAVLGDVYKLPSNLRVSRPKKSGKRQKETALLHLTDIHYGKLTQTYNTVVCSDRLLQLHSAVDEITGLRRNSAAIDELVILFGGDFLEGQLIFPGQSFSTDADIVQQALKDGPEQIANLVIHFAAQFPKVRIVAVPGNHGRTSKDGSGRFNADSIMYEIVRGLVSKVATNVVWDLPLDRLPGNDWYAHTVVDGHGVVLIHGDFKGGPTNTLGYPWYSIGRRTTSWVSVFPSFDYLYVGHNHSFAAFDVSGKTVYATGSLESDNEYAAKNFATAGEPHQRLQFFNASHGVLADHKLHVD